MRRTETPFKAVRVRWDPQIFFYKMKCYYKQIDVDILKKIIKESHTFSEVMRKLGYTANRGNRYVGFKEYINLLNIDCSHFKGKSHGTGGKKFKLSDIFCKDTKYTNMYKLKKYAIENNLLFNKCYKCGLTMWNDKPLKLQLHHINGDNRDNRIENLQLLCPNCHSQTDNFCKKNK